MKVKMFETMAEYGCGEIIPRVKDLLREHEPDVFSLVNLPCFKKLTKIPRRMPDDIKQALIDEVNREFESQKHLFGELSREEINDMKRDRMSQWRREYSYAWRMQNPVKRSRHRMSDEEIIRRALSK